MIQTQKARSTLYLLVTVCFLCLNFFAATESSATPIGRTIVIDGIMSDWYAAPAIPTNPGQFSFDAAGTVDPLDLDFPVQATGRDLRLFSYTWDNANLYVYVERYASTSNHNDWWFYLDLDNNGKMDATDRVLRVDWQGSNSLVNRELWNYTPLAIGGDPLTDVYGRADGYDMPGTIGGMITLSSNGPGGSAAGIQMESYVPWSLLGLPGPTSIGFHISSSNGTNLPNQLDDNMDGPGGGAGGGSGLVFLDLAVAVAASSPTVIGGATFSYTVSITNNGGGTATGVNLTDLLPAGVSYVADNSATSGTSYNALSGLWTVGTMTSGQTVSLTITATANPVAAVTTISNTAGTLNLNEADTNTLNNSASVNINVRPAPDLSITKTHAGFFNEGQNGIYSITVTNNGPGYDDGVKTVDDPLPMGLNYITFSGSGWTCQGLGQNVRCSNSSMLAAGASLPTLILYVTPDVNAVPTVNNTASISSTNFDANTANNTASDLTMVIPAGSQICYAIGNSGNVLTRIDTQDTNPATNEITIGATGVNGIKALAYDCANAVLYAANNGSFGTINSTTGLFTAIGTIGSGRGALGNINFNSITGLAYDKATGTLYASHATAGGAVDVLLKINPVNGQVVSDGFGPGVDYVPIGSSTDISDIAINQTNGQLYGIDYGASPDQLVQINTDTGLTTPLASTLAMNAMVGLGSDGVGGLWGSTLSTQQLYAVNSASGSAGGARTINNDNQYQAVDCLLNCVVRQVDLAVSKSVDSPRPLQLQTIHYTITVSNNGPDRASTVQLLDQLPAGVTYASNTPSQGSYDAASGIWYVGTLNNGASATLDIAATVNSGTAGTTITNTAAVRYRTQNDGNALNDTASVAITPMQSDLSSSTKTAVDLNGGQLQPGDIIEYTVVLAETTGASTMNVRLSDNMPLAVGNLTVISMPAGAINNSTVTGGANGTGFLDISGISVPGGGSSTVVFHVTVDAAAVNGTVISNTATISNPSGPGATPTGSPTLIVSGNPEIKQLYLNSLNTMSRTMSRTMSFSTTPVTIAKGATATWTMTPVSQTPMTLAGLLSIAVPVWITSVNGGAGNVTATLAYSGGSAGTIATPSVVAIPANATARYTFSFTPPANITLNPNTVFTLTLANGANKNISILPFNAGTHSQIDLHSITFVNVDLVDFYAAPYPNAITSRQVVPGTTVHVRAQVSDPFGSFDIASATVQVVDPLATTRVAAGTAMTLVNDSAAAIKTFEYSYTIPNAGPVGNWQFLVTANEGVEGVKHTAVGTLMVGYSPVLTVVKSSNVTTVKPGSVIVYTVQVSNTGLGIARSVLLDDHCSPYTAFGLNSYGVATPYQLTQGTTPSGLTMGAASYSNNDGASFVYTPVSGGGGAPAGYDGNITNWKLPMLGNMNPGSSFNIQYQMMAK